MKKIPKTPKDRPHDYFNIGDPVVIFIGRGVGCRIVNDVFVKGRVVSGYRYHNGCVSVCTHIPVHTKSYLKGHGLSIGMSRPEIMHLWEFKYLCKDLDFAKVFLEKSYSDKTNKRKFLTALKNGCLF